MTDESHIRDMLGVRRRSSNTQQQQQQQPEITINTDSSSQPADDVTDDDVIADRQCAAELGVEVCRFTCPFLTADL